MSVERFQERRFDHDSIWHGCDVECPRCGARAAVDTDEKKLTCVACGYSRVGPARHWRWQGYYRTTVEKHCVRCGTRFTRSYRRFPPCPEHVEAPCPDCGAEYLLWASWEAEGPAPGHDPCFGAPLWFRTHCAGRLLWALNERYLAFLRRYVGAALREQVPNRNLSLPARLPRWILGAKNRDAILECLERMENRC